MIQEIIYKQYNKKKLSKFDIVTNYLSNKIRSKKYISQYQVRQAVKNINEELEEAEKEFDKLFQNNKDY